MEQWKNNFEDDDFPRNKFLKNKIYSMIQY